MMKLKLKSSPIKRPPPNKGYQAYERDVIERLYPVYGAKACRSYLPWRSIDSINKFAEKNSIKSRLKSGGDRSFISWSVEEKSIIEEYHAELTDQVFFRLKKIKSKHSYSAVSTRLAEYRRKIKRSKTNNAPWSTEARVLLAKTIRLDTKDIVSALSKEGFSYSRKAVQHQRRRMLDNYVSGLSVVTETPNMPNIDHELTCDNISGILVNGETQTVKNGGLVETASGYELTKIMEPGDTIKFF